MDNKDIADQPTLPTLTSHVTPLLPKKIGPYKIESLLKKGGMSFLYLATSEESAKPIVIKVLSPKFIKNEEVVNRFLKEADIIKTSNHPNIIKLFGQGTWEQGLYIAMEFIQGISLKQFLLEKSLSLKKALEIVLQVSYALCHLHAHGIIHRDLKPENILITENGQIKVIDFGIAQLITEQKDDFKTKSFIGTPVYMSPEQKENPHNVSFASDIYSLGVLTYELVLGKLSHGVIHLSLIPQKLRNILEKAINSDLTKRYKDIVEFITDLSEYLKHLSEVEAVQQTNYDDIDTSFVKTDALFLSAVSPKWSQLDIAIQRELTISSYGLYLDFFKLSENTFAVVLANSEKKDLEAFIHLSILRGYVKMAMKNAKEKNEVHPSAILTKLQGAILDDIMKQSFFINLLVFNLATDQVFYANSLDTNSYLVDNTTQKVFDIGINNQKLSKTNTPTFIETTLNFKIGDRIILLTKKINLQKQNAIKNVILDNMLFSPRHQIEEIIKEFKSFVIKNENNPFMTICIQRRA